MVIVLNYPILNVIVNGNTTSCGYLLLSTGTAFTEKVTITSAFLYSALLIVSTGNPNTFIKKSF